MSLSIGVLFGLAAMLGFGFSNAMAKVPLMKIGEKKTVFFRAIPLSAVLLCVVALSWNSLAFSAWDLAIAFGISFIGYLPLLAFYKALKAGKVGVVTPIANSAVIFTVLLSVMFLGERLAAGNIAAIGMIVLGVVLVSFNPKDLKGSDILNISSGVPYALVACLLWGLVYFLFKIPVTALGAALATFITESGIMVFSGMHMAASKDSFEIPGWDVLPYIAAIAVMAAVGSLSFNLGIGTSDVSTVAALTFSNPLIAAIYGAVVYRERLTTGQYLAIAAIIAGIVLLAWGG